MAKGDHGKGTKPKTAGGKAGLTAEDVELFHRALEDVAPLRPEARRAPPEKKMAAKMRVSTTGAPKARLPDKARAAAPLPDMAVGTLAGVDRRTADRLRRGKLAIEARLDLHGLYQDEAHPQLNAFVAGAAAAQKRCVLVITGRGLGPEGGVLRRRVPQWLNQPPCRGMIVAVAQAQPEHGGAGALYVLLRRRR